MLPLLGQIAQRRGARALLTLGGVCIVPLPILWNVSAELPWLFAVQLFAGTAWSAYELAVMLLFFEALDREARLGLLALYNLGNAMCMLGGSLIGAWLLRNAASDGAAYARGVHGLDARAARGAAAAAPRAAARRAAPADPHAPDRRAPLDRLDPAAAGRGRGAPRAPARARRILTCARRARRAAAGDACSP